MFINLLFESVYSEIAMMLFQYTLYIRNKIYQSKLHCKYKHKIYMHNTNVGHIIFSCLQKNKEKYEN